MNVPSKVALTSTEVLEDTINCLSTQIPLKTEGAFKAQSLWQILVRAASCAETIEQTVKELKNVPCSNNVRSHLKKINHFQELEEKLNLTLKSRLPKGLRQKKQSVAIDFNLIPYYGNASSEETPFIYRSQAKNETCSFYAYATIYVIKKGKRGKNGVEYLVYVVYKVKISLSYIKENYRKRFGIKSSYRLKNFCRIRTTMKSPLIRVLFVGISFLLINIWVTFLWQRISHPRRGGRLIYYKQFPLKQMLSFLRQAVDEIFQSVNEVYIPQKKFFSILSPPT